MTLLYFNARRTKYKKRQGAFATKAPFLALVA